MGDRDALIVICWLAILLLVFFECFYRRLKGRFGRDIEPPQGFASVQTMEETGMEVVTGGGGYWGRRPPPYSHCTEGLGLRLSPGGKELVLIKMEEGEEEPPPSYEEALKLKLKPPMPEVESELEEESSGEVKVEGREIESVV